MRATRSLPLGLALLLSTVAHAANPHYLSEPTFSVSNNQLTACGTIAGLGNEDVFCTDYGGGFVGMSFRFYDPDTDQWSIYWADSRRPGLLDPPVIGSFDGDTGDFFGHEVVGGKDVIVRFHWDKRKPKAPIYSRAFSADGGRTWEWNWYSSFSPR